MTLTLDCCARSSRKAKGEGHSRRGEILRAAERIFIAEGYEAATIRKIADEVGVSSTTLYMHFRDKDDVLLEICREAMGELMRLNAEIAGRRLDAGERVKAMLRAYMEFAARHQNAYRLVFCASAVVRSAHRMDATLELGKGCFETFAAAVRQVAAEGRLRRGSPEAAAQALWAACHGLIALRLAKPNFPWAPDAELSEVLLEGLSHGLIAD